MIPGSIRRILDRRRAALAEVHDRPEHWGEPAPSFFDDRHGETPEERRARYAMAEGVIRKMLTDGRSVLPLVCADLAIGPALRVALDELEDVLASARARQGKDRT